MTGLARVQAVLRPRTGLEALDLGFRMVRAWWRPLLQSWLAFAVPVIAAVILALREHPYVTLLALWWLRAVLARIPLHVLAGRLFGEDVGLRETARALPRLLGAGLGTSLFTQRLSPARTLLLPVLQLEHLRGAARRRRSALLTRHDLSAAAGLLTVGAHITGAVIVGLVLVAQIATPPEIPQQPLAWLASQAGTPLLLPILYALASSLVEPLLVAGGFALYINRRVFLEGWDLEIAFRGLAERVAPAAPRGRPALAAGLALALLLGGVRAEARICDAEDPSSARACAEAVLRNPDFGGTRTELRYLPRELGSQTGEAPDFGVLAWLASVLAAAGRVALYVLAALAVVAMLIALRARAKQESPAEEAPLEARPMGLDLRPSSLPADLIGAARASFEKGEWIAALSLLYRGALVRLSQRGALDVAASATESECLALVRASQAEPTARLFGALTQSWLMARYAHRPPAAEEFDALCRGFDAELGGASR